MPMQYAYSILYVADVVETIDFYKRAFGFDQKFATPEIDYGELLSGGTTIAFASIEYGRPNFNGAFEKSTATKTRLASSWRLRPILSKQLFNGPSMREQSSLHPLQESPGANKSDTFEIIMDF